MYNNEFFQNMDSKVTGNNNVVNQDMDVEVNYGTPMMNPNPSYTGVRERVINRTFVHEVPQDCFFMIEK